MNITSQQKELLFVIVDAHLTGGGEPFMVVRDVSQTSLIYSRGRTVRINATEGDFRQLAEERLITLVFEPRLGGQPTQLGIGTAAFLRSKETSPSAIDQTEVARKAVADTVFWRQRQTDFLTYAIRFAELSAKWNAYHGRWILWWGSTTDGAKIPPEVMVALSETARKALTGLPSSGITEGREPWQLWLDAMRASAWRGFSVAGNHPVSELVWEAGVKVGRPPVVVRRELGLSTHDEPEADHRLTELALDDVFRESAHFCEGLARVLELVTPATQRDITGNPGQQGIYAGGPKRVPPQPEACAEEAIPTQPSPSEPPSDVLPHPPAQSCGDTYDPTWTLRGNSETLDKRREPFSRLARRAIIALGQKYTNRDEAVDAWLSMLHKFHSERKTEFARAHWSIRQVAEASAEYCAELSTRFHEDGNAESELKFGDLERQFRSLSDPQEEFFAIRRKDTWLRRNDYPFDRWLYDHPHESLPDLKMELDYWKTHVWEGYRAQLAHWEHLDRKGRAWLEVRKELPWVMVGLSYDLAVLQANYAIDRGLRGDQAMQVLQDETRDLSTQVTDAWLAGCARLGVSIDDGAEKVANVAQVFQRVRDCFRQLLRSLPPPALLRLEAEADPPEPSKKRKRGPKPDDISHRRVAEILAAFPQWATDLKETCARLADPPDGKPAPNISKAWRASYKIASYAEVFEAIGEKEIQQHIARCLYRGQQLLAGNSR